MVQPIINGAPRSILPGINDLSGREPVYEAEAVPTHLPHVFFFAQKGDLLPKLNGGDAMVQQYGSETFNVRSQYATHQTVLVNTINEEGNQLITQRVVPDDAAPPATLRLSVDVMADNIPQYERTVDGDFILDSAGAKIPTNTTVPGYILRWLVEQVGEENLGEGQVTLSDSSETVAVRSTESGDLRITTDGALRILENELGTAGTTVGGMVSGAGEQSTIYPILEFEARDIGSYGNNLGVRLSAPTTLSTSPTDTTLIEDQLAYIYRLQLVERQATSSTPKVLETLAGEQFIDFAFKDGVVNTRTDQDLSLSELFIDSWHQEAAGGYPEIRSAFGDYHLYTDNLEHVLGLVHAEESKYGLVPEGEDAIHMVNVLTGTDPYRIPYYATIVRGPSEDGLLFSESSTVYARGGFDGTMTFSTFDAAVAYQCENYGDLDAKFLDDALYPQSCLYDSGFTLETKKKMLVPMGRRKDLYVVLSTQDVSMVQNSESEETSIAIALRAAARMYPESEIYGTPACRVIIIGSSGYLLNSNYKKLLPLTIEFAQKCARYMGASSGSWTSGNGFDNGEGRLITMFHKVNATYKSANARNKDWDAGLVWPQSYDRRSLFWPAVQTVYDDDTSILNAATNMMIAVELEKVANRNWREFTGTSKLSNAQLIERSNESIADKAKPSRFDNRVIIQPDTYLTPADEQRGYSWAAKIHMYGPNMKTVGTTTVVTHRLEDIEV